MGGPGKKLKDFLELASCYCNSNHPELHQEYREDCKPDDERPILYWGGATYRRWEYEYIEEINLARSLKKVEDFKNSMYLKKSANELRAILLNPSMGLI